MLKFLKGLFKPKETEETIGTDRLLFWFDERVKEKLKNVENEIDIFFQGAENRKGVLEERKEALEKAEIKEPEKVDERIKNIVLGNRENYTRSLKIFLNELVLPEEKTVKTAFDFNLILKEKLDELASSTAKSFSTAQHLFYNEIEQIARGLKDLDDLAKSFDALVQKNKIKEIEMTRKIIDLLNEKIAEKERLEKELAGKKEKFNGLKQVKAEKLKDVELLEQSNDFKSYQGLKDSKDKLDNEIKENMSSFLQIFAQLERSFRKYEHAAGEKAGLVKSYLENPIETFFKDESLVFWEILDGVKKNLEQEDLGLKDSKKEKTMEIISELDKTWLRNIQQKHKSLMEERNILMKKIDNSFVKGKLSDACYKLEHFDAQMADLEQEIKELEELLGKIDLEKIKDALKEKVLEAFRVKLTIS